MAAMVRQEISAGDITPLAEVFSTQPKSCSRSFILAAVRSHLEGVLQIWNKIALDERHLLQ